MKSQLDHEQRGDVLLVRFPEYETADQARPHIDAALALSDDLGVNRMIVDTTVNSIALSALEYTRVGQYISRRPSAARLRVAIVRRPTLLSEARLLEEDLSRRGLAFRIFPDVAAAEEWLADG